MISETIFTIDPGAAGTGIAIWDAKQWDVAIENNIRKKLSPLKVVTPVLHYARTFKDQERYFDLLKSQLSEFNCTSIYCEKPKFMGESSIKGRMVAITGGLVTLSAFTGGLRGVAWAHKQVPFHFVEISEWKGTLQKSLVNEKILRVWPECQARSHDWDAIGIGFYLLGLINNPKRKEFDHG